MRRLRFILDNGTPSCLYELALTSMDEIRHFGKESR